MIQMQFIGDRYWPILTCGQCNQPVARIGYVVWTVDPATTLTNGGPFLTHIGCRDLLTAQWPNATWIEAELPTFMGQLIQVQLGT